MNQVDFIAFLLRFPRSKLIGLCQASQCNGSRTEVQNQSKIPCIHLGFWVSQVIMMWEQKMEFQWNDPDYQTCLNVRSNNRWRRYDCLKPLWNDGLFSMKQFKQLSFKVYTVVICNNFWRFDILNLLMHGSIESNFYL